MMLNLFRAIFASDSLYDITSYSGALPAPSRPPIALPPLPGHGPTQPPLPPSAAGTGGGHDSVVQGFIILFALLYYFVVILLGMALLRSLLAPDELRGDRGDRDTSYWHYHVGMSMLRIWSGMPRRFRKRLLLGDIVKRPDGTSMRFLSYLEVKRRAGAGARWNGMGLVLGGKRPAAPCSQSWY